MRTYILIVGVLICLNSSLAQNSDKVISIDFVQILNGNKAEAVYYYKNNWQWLREKAIEKNYIDSYELLESKPTEEAPFEIVLMTIYSDKEQFEKSEEHFEELIELKGPLRLLNDKEPKQFRKVLFHKDATSLK